MLTLNGEASWRLEERPGDCSSTELQSSIDGSYVGWRTRIVETASDESGRRCIEARAPNVRDHRNVLFSKNRKNALVQLEARNVHRKAKVSFILSNEINPRA
jgi:hypothetical protein